MYTPEPFTEEGALSLTKTLLICIALAITIVSAVALAVVVARYIG